jgi:bifunctional UDP-N-acetylglucosamine pyrophosphorylase/glucosamine-1-phosphate N-acetyltransferase
MKITYVVQKEQLGTGHAVLQAEKFVDGRFIVMNGDDLFSGKDIKKLLGHSNALLAVNKGDNCQFGVCLMKGGKFAGILEKPQKPEPGLCNIGCYLFEKDVFDVLKKLKKSPRGEIELTDAVTEIARKKEFAVEEIGDYWLPMTYPWNLLEANSHFLKSIKTDIKGTVEKGATIKGAAVIGKGTVVKSGTYIEGPVMIGEDCVIGPNAYIRPDTTIGDRCKVRGEVFDAVFMDDAVAKHHSYIGHSVLGVDVNIGAGTITSDYRHDGKNNVTIVNGKKVDSGRRKLGSFMGDHVRTGINTCIYPGRKLWPDTGTLPGEIVAKDITEANIGKK